MAQQPAGDGGRLDHRAGLRRSIVSFGVAIDAGLRVWEEESGPVRDRSEAA